MSAESLAPRVVEFVRTVTGAMGLTVEVEIEETPDGPRVNLSGDGANRLLAQRGEALHALQHVVDSVFRHDMEEGKRVLVDCLGFRRDKDLELRQMAMFLGEKARTTGEDQQIGPLNSYERRIVHLAIAEDPELATESVGDASRKTVLISRRT